MQLHSTTRPVVGLVLSIIGICLCVASLVLKRWYVCDLIVFELEFGLQDAQVTEGGLSASAEVCTPELQLVTKVPCQAGKVTLGLGAAAAALMGLGMVFAGIIAHSRRLGGWWGGALAVNMLGGVLAIVAGSTYVARMSELASDIGVSSVCTGQAAPVLMMAGGAIGIIASCLFCSCCCRPATFLPATFVQPVAMVRVNEWQGATQVQAYPVHTQQQQQYLHHPQQQQQQQQQQQAWQQQNMQ